MTAEDKLLDTAQAAHHLGYSVSALETWRCEGKGPKYLKLHRRVRYRLSDLDAWLDAGTIEPARRAS